MSENSSDPSSVTAPSATAPAYSLEFFPPRTDAGIEKLKSIREELYPLGPAYCSVTFGAGGSTQEGTVETVRDIMHEGHAEAAPHLSCIGTTRETIAGLLRRYQDLGVRRIVALRGDLPSGSRDYGDFHYASQLVEFIRETSGDTFHLEVAAYPEFHPEAKSPDADIDNFIRKIDAGAHAGITQYFFNAEAYFRFVDSVRGRGCDAPVVPGIMPITNYTQLARFSDQCGAEIPRWIRQRLEAWGDDLESIRSFGHDVVLELCEQLMARGAPGLHFYTLNQATAIKGLWTDLKLPAAG